MRRAEWISHWYSRLTSTSVVRYGRRGIPATALFYSDWNWNKVVWVCMGNGKGQVMLLTVLIVSGTVLGATTVAGLLMVYQMRQATNFGESLQALFAADTGLEWQLYRKFQNADYPAPVLGPETNASFVTTVDASSSIRSVGCAGTLIQNAREGGCPRPVNRAFELIFK
jgi:hypothetical protein